jgi:hypothetical protein
MQKLNDFLSRRLIIVIFMLAGLVVKVCIADSNHSNLKTTRSHQNFELVGGKMVLQIETVSGSNISNTPNKGVFVQHYLGQKQVALSGVGDQRFLAGAANYSIYQASDHILIEELIDHISGQKSETKYRFDGKNEGEWKRSFESNDILISGHFKYTDKDALNAVPLVPIVQSGKTLALTVLHSSSDTIPSGAYPGAGSVILQLYSEGGSYTAKGYGPGTVDHFGTYEATVVSPSMVVEQTLQTIPELNYTVPYTLVYTYETVFSGTWYQSFANGLIVFSGTFSIFDSE